MEHWLEKSIHFNFRMGELTLFAWQLPALVSNQHFTEMSSDLVSLQSFPEYFSSTREVLVIRSHPLEAPIPRLTVLSQAIRYVSSYYKRYWVEFNGDFDNYLKKFSTKSRNTLTRKIKKFTEFSGGELAWREFVHVDEMTEFHRLALEVSVKTYQERLLDCGLPTSQAFIDTMLALAKQDRVRGYILFHQSRPIAYIYCPIHDGIVFYEYLGHDPDFQRWSPGTILQYFCLKSLFDAKKFRLFDFTEGEGAHKAFFSTHSKYCADIYYFRRTWRNLAMLRLHAGVDVLSNGIVKILEKLRLKAYIKKLVRSAA